MREQDSGELNSQKRLKSEYTSELKKWIAVKIDEINHNENFEFMRDRCRSYMEGESWGMEHCLLTACRRK